MLLLALKHTNAVYEKTFKDEVCGEEDCRDEGYLDGVHDALIAVNDFMDGDDTALERIAGEEKDAGDE